MWPFKQETTGFVPDSFDERDIWEDEVLGSGDIEDVPPSYNVENLVYDQQGKFPFCVSFACSTLLEHLYNKDGMSRAFSQPHLFFHAGGTSRGSGFRANLQILKNKGAIPYSQMPMPGVKADDWEEALRKEAIAKPFNEAQTLKGYVKVTPTAEHLKKAVMAYGPLLVGVQAKGDYYSGSAKRSSGEDNHAVLLAGWTPRQWVIFDSLRWVEKKGGYGTLDAEYKFNTAYAVTELPKNFVAKVEKVRSKPFEDALNHFGKVRNLEAEQRNAVKLLDAFKRFNNKSVLDAAGRFWTVYTNCLTYGDYTVTDLVNDTYNWRRTGQHIFDLNSSKK